MRGGKQITRYNNEWFKKRIREKRPNDYKEYEFLDEYVNAKTYLRAIHKPCGEEVNILPNSFISRGSGCPKCARKSVSSGQMKTQEEFEKEVPEGMVVVGKYRGAHRKVRVYCSLCDNEYDTTPSTLNRRNRCTRCLGSHRRTIEEVKKEIDEWSRGSYEVVSREWESTHTHIDVRHKECGNVYGVTRSNFKKGRRCPKCSESIGESLTRDVLKELEVEYTPQKGFPDLMKDGPLTYDFYIESKNILIEYQGEQHYKPIEHFGGMKQFIVQQENDSIKREYARRKGIKLVEIPYTITSFKDIKEIVERELLE